MKMQILNSKVSRWGLIAAMTSAIAGCAGGSLTPREQGAGIGAHAVLQLAQASAVRSTARVWALLSARLLDSVRAR